ncbi:TetR/AcrR family transcriptional regulator [Enterococcus hirae]
MYEYATNTFNNLRREKQVRILTGLLKLMGKKGFHGTTTRELCQAEVMKPGTLYQYFISKERMLYVAMEYFFEVMHQCQDKIDKGNLRKDFPSVLLIIKELQEEYPEIFLFYYRISLDKDMSDIFFKYFDIKKSFLHLYIEDKIRDSELEYFSDNLLLSFVIINTTEYFALKNRIFIKEEQANYLLLKEVFEELFKRKKEREEHVL